MHFKNCVWQFVSTNIQLLGATHLGLKYFHKTLTFCVVTVVWTSVFKKNVIKNFESVLLKQKHNDKNNNVNIKVQNVINVKKWTELPFLGKSRGKYDNFIETSEKEKI